MSKVDQVPGRGESRPRPSGAGSSQEKRIQTNRGVEVAKALECSGLAILIWGCLGLAALPSQGLAFNKAGCGAGECRECHSLDMAEAAGLVSGMARTVEGVGFAKIPGLFEVQTVTNGHRFPLLVDFSKSWVLQANVAPVRGK